MHALEAQPKVHVAYQREAWVSRDNNFLRVTLDRELRGAAIRHVRLATQMVEPVRATFEPYGSDIVILELKYTHYFPEWYRDLVTLFNLTQSGAPKYCSCVMHLGEEHSSAAGGWNRAMPRRRW
jgi:hypothetical protein